MEPDFCGPQSWNQCWAHWNAWHQFWGENCGPRRMIGSFQVPIVLLKGEGKVGLTHSLPSLVYSATQSQVIELGAGGCNCPDHKEGGRMCFTPLSLLPQVHIAISSTQHNGLEVAGGVHKGGDEWALCHVTCSTGSSQFTGLAAATVACKGGVSAFLNPLKRNYPSWPGQPLALSPLSWGPAVAQPPPSRPKYQTWLSRDQVLLGGGGGDGRQNPCFCKLVVGPTIHP